MKTCTRVSLAAIAALVLFQSSVSAKLPTVKIVVSGPGLPTELPLADKKLLVNVWGGARPSEGWSDFPQPFIGATVSAPPAPWRLYSVAFVAEWTPREQRVVYKIRYVPDWATGGGYIYLPGPNEPDGRLNESTIIRHQDGSWTRASAEWSAALNAHLPR